MIQLFSSMNNDEKILKTIEDLKLGQTRIEKRLDNTATKQDIGQLHRIVEAVRARQAFSNNNIK